MQISAVVNNNVVMSIDEKNNELILVGKGLGFQAKKNDLIDETKIQKKFYLENQDLFSKFKSILNEVSSEELLVTSEIINYAQVHLNKKLNESIYVTLSDHIHFAIERSKKSELISNTFVWDIKHYYSDEFQVALYAIDLLNKKFDLSFNDDEAGFIAFHFINAEMGLEKSVDAAKLTTLVHQIINVVSYQLKYPIDTQNVNGYRFINHVKYFSQRVLENNEATVDAADIELYEIVKEKYQESFNIMEKVQQFLQAEYNYKMGKNDRLYFMIHIHRLIEHIKNL